MTDPRVLLDNYGRRTLRGVPNEARAPKAFAALRAVLDLHKPFQEFPDEPAACGGCTFDPDDRELHVAYPCTTVRAITTALEAQ